MKYKNKSNKKYICIQDIYETVSFFSFVFSSLLFSTWIDVKFFPRSNNFFKADFCINKKLICSKNSDAFQARLQVGNIADRIGRFEIFSWPKTEDSLLGSKGQICHLFSWDLIVPSYRATVKRNFRTGSRETVCLVFKKFTSVTRISKNGFVR